MKKFASLLFALSVLLAIPSTSYALVDFGVYGGYGFAGHLEEVGTPSPEGAQYGAFVRYCGSVVPAILDLGIGAFYQRSDQGFTYLSTDFQYDRDAAGIDAFAELKIIPILKPFAKFQINVIDRVQRGGGSDGTMWFRTYAAGGGAFFKIFPKLYLFGEVMYSFGFHNGDDYRSTAVNAGVRIKI